MSAALDAARSAGLLAKHRPTVAYHKQEPYFGAELFYIYSQDRALHGRVARRRAATAASARPARTDDLRRTASRALAAALGR